MTFEEAKALQTTRDAEVTRIGNALDAFPKGAMGLTPDEVKFSPEYRQAKADFSAAFKKLQNINHYLSDNFAKEIREERMARRRA